MRLLQTLFQKQILPRTNVSHVRLHAMMQVVRYINDFDAINKVTISQSFILSGIRFPGKLLKLKKKTYIQWTRHPKKTKIAKE